MFSPFLKTIVTVLILSFLFLYSQQKQERIFDVHLHGDPAAGKQLANLKENGVYAIAVSTSWPQQLTYQTSDDLRICFPGISYKRMDPFLYK